MTVYPRRTQAAIERLASLTYAYDRFSDGSRLGANTPPRHKVFVSYHAEDAPEVVDFIESHTSVFLPRAIGMEEDGSDIIDSQNVEYIRRTIKQKYLRDSTVTLVAVGACTWARKFVDWEIYSSLRFDPAPNGLLAVQLPSVAGTKPNLPPRLSLNLSDGGDPSYANYWVPPATPESLRGWIETAYNARASQRDLIKLGGPLRQRNSTCER